MFCSPSRSLSLLISLSLYIYIYIYKYYLTIFYNVSESFTEEILRSSTQSYDCIAVEYTNFFSAEVTPPQRVSWYDTKQSDGEVPVMLEL